MDEWDIGREREVGDGVKLLVNRQQNGRRFGEY